MLGSWNAFQWIGTNYLYVYSKDAIRRVHGIMNNTPSAFSMMSSYLAVACGFIIIEAKIKVWTNQNW